jgi:hypothetical protein
MRPTIGFRMIDVLSVVGRLSARVMEGKMLRLMLVLAIAVGVRPALAQAELKPLVEVIGAEDSAPNTLYVLRRCSALGLELFSRARSRPKNDSSAELQKVGFSIYEKFASVATHYLVSVRTAGELTGSIDFQKASDQSLEIIGEIARLYSDDMDHHFNRTGNAFSDQILQDLNICISLGK